MTHLLFPLILSLHSFKNRDHFIKVKVALYVMFKCSSSVPPKKKKKMKQQDRCSCISLSPVLSSATRGQHRHSHSVSTPGEECRIHFEVRIFAGFVLILVFGFDIILNHI